jgi:hypothetical protein
MKKLMYIIFAVILAACNDNPSNPNNENEHDLPTTLKIHIYQLNDSGNGEIKDSSITLFDQPGGPGTPITLTPITLKFDNSKSTFYKAEIEVLNKSNSSNIIDVTKEIKLEAEYHQFFFTTLQKNKALITYGDKESDYTSTNLNGSDLPVGLKFLIEVPKNASVSNDTLSISLSHFPDATKKDGVTAGNETDIFVNFPIIYQK